MVEIQWYSIFLSPIAILDLNLFNLTSFSFLSTGAIDEFNKIQKELLHAKKWIIADESLSDWHPRTTALGDYRT